MRFDRSTRKRHDLALGASGHPALDPRRGPGPLVRADVGQGGDSSGPHERGEVAHAPRALVGEYTRRDRVRSGEAADSDERAQPALTGGFFEVLVDRGKFRESPTGDGVVKPGVELRAVG